MSTDAHLALAEGQEHSVEEWEAAAAAVLRKAGRLGADDPDDAVWQKLGRRTLDGIAITPLGTPALVADLPEPVRAPARGDGWDVRALLADPDAKASHEAALTDLENGATSLLVQVGESGVAARDLAAVLEGVLLDVAPVVLDAPSDPLGAARAFAEVARGTTLAAGTNLGVDPVGASLRGFGPFETGLDGPPQGPEAPLVRRRSVDAGSASSGAGRWSSTARRCTTSVPPTSRSSATSSRSVPTTCASSPRRGSRSTRPPRWWSSGSRPPTSSSRRSPSCAPYDACGHGCWSSAAPPRTTGRWCCTP